MESKECESISHSYDNAGLQVDGSDSFDVGAAREIPTSNGHKEEFTQPKNNFSNSFQTISSINLNSGCLNDAKLIKKSSYNVSTSQVGYRKRCFNIVKPFLRGPTGDVISWIVFALIFYGSVLAITGKQALPEGNLFSLLALLILANLGGKLVALIHLPPLLGMLIVGVLLRSIPFINVIGSSIDHRWSAVLRKMALVVILTRAGLGLDAKALRELSLTVIRLGILPNLVEMVIVGVVSHFLLDFPWLWSFMLGFIFSGVSPSVVVPCMLMVAEKRLGIDKGVPTLIIAGLSIDNALSISGIGVFVGIIFSTGSVTWQAFKGPVEVLVGIAWGILVGFVCWEVPNRFTKGYEKFRFFFLFVLGLLCIFGSEKLSLGGAGAMGCLTTAFVAGIGWRKQGWPDNKHPVKKSFNFLWCLFQPLLFGLIGTEINIATLQGSTVLWGFITLLVGLTFRVVTCFLVVHGSTLNFKEKLFAAISWLPKATIQAAFGSVAYDYARSIDTDPTSESPEEIYGKQVISRSRSAGGAGWLSKSSRPGTGVHVLFAGDSLSVTDCKIVTLAVLAIVIAAPIGAIAIVLSAPRLLKYTPLEGEDPEGHKEEKVTNSV